MGLFWEGRGLVASKPDKAKTEVLSKAAGFPLTCSVELTARDCLVKLNGNLKALCH
jgi:hypothetical protein